MLETILDVDIFEIRTPARELETEKVRALMESISEKGLISPIAISPDLCLQAGAHRLAAFKALYQEVGDSYRHISARVIEADNNSHHHQIETTEKLFHPQLSILEKAGHFKSYFDDLKYGQAPCKTTTIFKTLDISRRTFFNLRAIAERLSDKTRQRILNSSLKAMANSTPQLMALCKYEEDMQLAILEHMEAKGYHTVFEAIKAHLSGEEITVESTKRKLLMSPSLKLEKELRQDLRNLSKSSGVGQNELFNEIFAAGLEIIQHKYR